MFQAIVPVTTEGSPWAAFVVELEGEAVALVVVSGVEDEAGDVEELDAVEVLVGVLSEAEGDEPDELSDAVLSAVGDGESLGSSNGTTLMVLELDEDVGVPPIAQPLSALMAAIRVRLTIRFTLTRMASPFGREGIEQ